MRVFPCSNCRQTVYFQNVKCEHSGMALGFDPQAMTMRTLHPDTNGKLVTAARTPGRKPYCANYNNDVCNWLIPIAEDGELCLSCGLNKTTPDLTINGNLERWFEVEKAKRRLVYQTLKLRLPLKPSPIPACRRLRSTSSPTPRPATTTA